IVEIRAPIIITDPLGELTSRKQAVAFGDIALAMDPFGLNRVQPGALSGEKEGQNAHALARLLHVLVVLAYPGAHHLRDVPARVIPDQQPIALAQKLETLTAPVEKLNADRTHRPSCDEAQPHLISHRLLSVPSLPENSVARQCFGIGIAFPPRL